MLERRGSSDYVKAADFNDPSFRDAHADYLLGEIRDQLLFYYNQAEYDVFLQFFSHLNGHKKFSYKRFSSAFNSFIAECATSGQEIPQFFHSVDVFLQFLYEQNVICYIEKDEGDEERFIRWCFRERTPSNLAPKVRLNAEYEIFYGLTKALNVGRPIRIKREHSDREVGTIISIFKEKGFGFIRGGAKQSEYYFKADELRFDVPPAKLGDKVSYETQIKYGKMRAVDIQRSR